MRFHHDVGFGSEPHSVTDLATSGLSQCCTPYEPPNSRHVKVGGRKRVYSCIILHYVGCDRLRALVKEVHVFVYFT